MIWNAHKGEWQQGVVVHLCSQTCNIVAVVRFLGTPALLFSELYQTGSSSLFNFYKEYHDTGVADRSLDVITERNCRLASISAEVSLGLSGGTTRRAEEARGARAAVFFACGGAEVWVVVCGGSSVSFA